MSDQEFLEFSEAIRQWKERQETDEEVHRRLVGEGLLTEEGHLAPNYR
ncbi:MAG: hypothetical protein HQL41_09630 [Alphaproteobacteria bacterium]|nr:hypothetical protein [Alphaproteobacteria bacterium]